MREVIQAWLLRWAYGPVTPNPFRRLRRAVARWLLSSDSDAELVRGAFAATIAVSEPALPHAVSIRPTSDTFGPLQPAVAVARGMTIEATDFTMRAVDPPAQLGPDPLVREWLSEVTEPYILWDSPKPRFVFPTDYFYDYMEPLAQVVMPAYVRPDRPHGLAVENPSRAVLTRLSKDRELFTLSPEAVRLRSTH